MSASFDFQTTVAYDTAGLRFRVSLGGPEEAGGATFTLTADNLATGERLSFDHAACSALHDFTRGYARWLATRGITATRGTTRSRAARARGCRPRSCFRWRTRRST